LAIYLLAHFGFIWAFGNYHVGEQQPAIILLEIIIVLAIMIFSFVCMIKQLDSIGSRRRKQGK
jgi:hypothetical protein